MLLDRITHLTLDINYGDRYQIAVCSLKYLSREIICTVSNFYKSHPMVSFESNINSRAVGASQFSVKCELARIRYQFQGRRQRSVLRTAIARGAAGDVDVELEAGRRVAAVAVATAGASVVEEAPRRAGGRRGRGGDDTSGGRRRRSRDGDGGSGAGATYEGVATCHTDVQRRRSMRTPDADVARDRLVHRAATLLRRKLLLSLLLLLLLLLRLLRLWR